MARTPFQNALLSALPADEVEALRPQLQFVDLQLRDIVVHPMQPISHVHFIESGLLSVVTSPDRSDAIEVGVIGREGMSGHTLALGIAAAPIRVFAQRPSTAYRMTAEGFRRACAGGGSLQAVVLRYVHVLATQVAETARSNGRFSVEARLARWLLMAHDRSDGDDISMTHEFLALMLGVRRPGVTVALHVLEGERMIRSTRGQVQVLDRAKLEAAARGSYGLPEAEFARLFRQDGISAGPNGGGDSAGAGVQA